MKEIKLCCNACHITYNPDLNSMICPHAGFPRTKLCKIHNRTDCGNLECEPDYVAPKENKIKFPERERKEA